MKDPRDYEGYGMTDDPVTHPSHYNHGNYEVIDVINDWKLNFNIGNTLKYLARSDHKGKKLEDLKKAKFYLEYEIARLAEEERAKKVFSGPTMMASVAAYVAPQEEKCVIPSGHRWEHIERGKDLANVYICVVCGMEERETE